MKYGLYLLLLVVFVACHSNRTMDRTTENKSVAEGTDTVAQVDSTRTSAEQRDSTSTITSVSMYAKTTFFGDSGGISSIREEWWDAESSGVAVRSGRTSEVHVTGRNETAHRKMEQSAFETIKEAVKTDSRLVQGNEWGWFAAAFVLVVVIFGYWEYRKRT
jgi:hypothetical protein